ncbi:MAG: hypothetical protein ACFE89_11270 [Candidatus Hodarchaeota archaeon]
MRRTRPILAILTVSMLLLTVSGTVMSTQPQRILAYTPTMGHSTRYSYGFVSVQPNQTATNIHFWTGLNLAESNYTLRWQQFVNLTIRVTNLALIGNVLRAYYNFSVNIHSNIATVSNTSWQTMVTMNGSVTAPAPTGVYNDLIDFPITYGFPGFFLDDFTLSSINVGSNIDIGGSRWNSVDYTTFLINGNEELCYQLFNSSTTTDTHFETTFIIDHDVGIYYQANDTRLLSVGSIRQSLTYHYKVLSTNIPPNPPPNPLPILLIVGTAIAILIIVIILLIRTFVLRRQH